MHGATQCLKCGAAARPHQHQCGYCGAALTYVACPKCFCQAPSDARHCPGCGTSLEARSAPQELEASGGACPRCHPAEVELLRRELGGLELSSCPGCGGVFIESMALDTLMKDGDQQAQVFVALGPSAAAERSSTAPRPQEPIKYLPCPSCKNLMSRYNFGRSSGVIIDRCTSHGTWFDATELERVLAFVRTGGLDVARRREIEELEDRLKERRREAQSQRSSFPAGNARDSGFGLGTRDLTDGVDLALELVATAISAFFRHR